MEISQKLKLGLIIQFLFLLIFIPVAFGEGVKESTIIDIRRNIPLSDEEVPIRDYYLNIGENKGVKTSQNFTVQRKIQVKDSSGAQSYGEILIPVGEVKVIAVYPSVSIAREVKLLSREKLPMLEQRGILVGDRVDLIEKVADK